MDIRPIRTDEEHRAALAAIEACWGAPEGTEEGDKLDVLLALVDIYEAKRWPIEIDETFDPIDVLRYAIDELGHTQAELAELLGSRSRASEVLSRRRALTVEMIHKLGEAWKIPADLLVRPYKIERAACPAPPAIVVERLRAAGYRATVLACSGVVGALGEIRTPDPRIRSPMLYPAELRAHRKYFSTVSDTRLVWRGLGDHSLVLEVKLQLLHHLG